MASPNIKLNNGKEVCGEQKHAEVEEWALT